MTQDFLIVYLAAQAQLGTRHYPKKVKIMRISFFPSARQSFLTAVNRKGESKTKYRLTQDAENFIGGCSNIALLEHIKRELDKPSKIAFGRDFQRPSRTLLSLFILNSFKALVKNDSRFFQAERTDSAIALSKLIQRRINVLEREQLIRDQHARAEAQRTDAEVPLRRIERSSLPSETTTAGNAETRVALEATNSPAPAAPPPVALPPVALPPAALPLEATRQPSRDTGEQRVSELRLGHEQTQELGTRSRLPETEIPALPLLPLPRHLPPSAPPPLAGGPSLVDRRGSRAQFMASLSRSQHQTEQPRSVPRPPSLARQLLPPWSASQALTTSAPALPIQMYRPIHVRGVHISSEGVEQNFSGTTRFVPDNGNCAIYAIYGGVTEVNPTIVRQLLSDFYIILHTHRALSESAYIDMFKNISVYLDKRLVEYEIIRTIIGGDNIVSLDAYLSSGPQTREEKLVALYKVYLTLPSLRTWFTDMDVTVLHGLLGIENGGIISPDSRASATYVTQNTKNLLEMIYITNLICFERAKSAFLDTTPLDETSTRLPKETNFIYFEASKKHFHAVVNFSLTATHTALDATS